MRAGHRLDTGIVGNELAAGGVVQPEDDRGNLLILAERARFELARLLRTLRFSRPVQSTALPPLPVAARILPARQSCDRHALPRSATPAARGFHASAWDGGTRRAVSAPPRPVHRSVDDRPARLRRRRIVQAGRMPKTRRADARAAIRIWRDVLDHRIERAVGRYYAEGRC